MEKFVEHEGVAVAIDAANIDTDQIIPKQFLLAVSRRGFGVHLFHDLRYLDDKEQILNEDFNLNKKEFAGASILVARDNFGNGSSREHAPWALMDYGFRAIIAPSFADIFNNNALGNGLLTVVLKEHEVDTIFRCIDKNPGLKIKINLETCKVYIESYIFDFSLDPFRRHCLLQGLDAISLTLQHEDKIKAFESKCVPSYIALDK